MFYMFTAFLIFLFSAIVEIAVILLMSPIGSNEKINHVAVFLFSINSGVLLGTLYGLLLIFLYWLLGSSQDLQRKTFKRRSIMLGIFVSLFLLLKIYSLMDTFIVALMTFTFIAIDVILSLAKEK